jgi:chromosome segregation ATPase
MKYLIIILVTILAALTYHFAHKSSLQAAALTKAERTLANRENDLAFLNAEIERLNAESEILAKSERTLRDQIADLEDAAPALTRANARIAELEAALADRSAMLVSEEAARNQSAATEAKAASEAAAAKSRANDIATRRALLTEQLAEAEATLKQWRNSAEAEELDYQQNTGIKPSETDRQKRRDQVNAAITQKANQITTLKQQLATLR